MKCSIFARFSIFFVVKGYYILNIFCKFARETYPQKYKFMATDKVAYWLDIANYDLDTAEAMHQTGRWLYVAFMCHQVIEKPLKAYWCATQPNAPPYTHSHTRLAGG